MSKYDLVYIPNSRFNWQLNEQYVLPRLPRRRKPITLGGRKNKRKLGEPTDHSFPYGFPAKPVITTEEPKDEDDPKPNNPGSMSRDFNPPFRFGAVKNNYQAGAFYKWEQGGTSFNDECMYSIVRPNDDYAIKAIILAIGRKLASHWGCPFYNVFDQIGPNMVIAGTPSSAIIRIGYKNNPESPLTEWEFNTENENWDAFANSFLSHWRTNHVVGQHWHFQYANIHLINERVAVAYESYLASVDLTDMRISFAQITTTVYQNRTGGAADTDTDKDSIKANPVIGTRYIKYGEQLSPRRETARPGTQQNFRCPNQQNIDFINWNDVRWSTKETSLLRRPPSKQALEQVKLSNKMILHPGQFHKSQIKYELDENLNSFMERFSHYSTGSTGLCNIGVLEVIGWDKLVHTGAGGGNIQIGLETNMTCLAKIYPPKRRFFCDTIQFTDDVTLPPAGP